jgi:alpha-L-fucosidase 2
LVFAEVTGWIAAALVCLLLPCIALASGESSPAPAHRLLLWYDSPAGPDSGMNEALPIGNGRMGGLVYGGTSHDKIVFNEDSLWTGNDNPTGAYDDSSGTYDPFMGAYQKFGEVQIELPTHEAVSAYRRDLDIGRAVASVSYQADGVHYRREYLCSHPAQALLIRLTADRPAAYTGLIRLIDAHQATTQATIKAEGGRLTITGHLSNGLEYEAQLAAHAEGGTLQVSDGALRFEGCSSVTLTLTAGTSYAMNPATGYRGAPPHERVTDQLNRALTTPYETLLSAHIRDYRSLFDRVSLDLGPAPADRHDLPTDRRKARDTAGDDGELEALLFQYGRYLLISCSRPGGLPANLQGLWNDSNVPAWASDYHANINVQMNYWPAEATNLAECHLPFFDLIRSQIPLWRRATAAEPEFKLASGAPVRGWALRTSHNIYGGMGWNWDKSANAWYCRHLWEHYAYSGDRAFLREIAYPILKETCQFWEDHLKALPDGRLVVPNAWSPEHGPVEDGVSYSQEIVWDLFSNYDAAARALQVDTAYRTKIAGLLERLVTPKIGHWGQLQEWMTDRDDPNDHHRHTSHLYAVYPGRQIGPETTPELARAAAVSLTARGQTDDSNREWAFAWRTALWARLHEPEKAHRMVVALLSTPATCRNLFGDHPPMQIDGNFGITAGIAEMLLQSREKENGENGKAREADEIHLLPALPQAWKSGSVHGLRARAGIVVDESWHDGRLTEATLRCAHETVARVRYGAAVREVKLRPNQPLHLGVSDLSGL